MLNVAVVPIYTKAKQIVTVICLDDFKDQVQLKSPINNIKNISLASRKNACIYRKYSGVHVCSVTIKQKFAITFFTLHCILFSLK